MDSRSFIQSRGFDVRVHGLPAHSDTHSIPPEWFTNIYAVGGNADKSQGGRGKLLLYSISLVLVMAACVGNLEPSMIQAAMLETKTKDVDTWTKNQVGTTTLAKRRRAFGKGWQNKMNKIQPKCTGIPVEEAVVF